MAALPTRTKLSLALISAVLLSGTIYSYQYGTYLDTSNPLIANLPHPEHKLSYFANKQNILNQWFVKKSWGWTTLAFWTLWFTAPEGSLVKTPLSIARWAAATGIWMTFASWFFGPSIFRRIGTFTGTECVVVLPATTDSASPALYTIPAHFCESRTLVSPSTHPALFTTTDAANIANIPKWTSDLKGIMPRFSRGHDVSGHTFLLTLSVLFLVDHLVRARRVTARGDPSPVAVVGFLGVSALVVLWIVMLGATAVYFHTWQEKLSGFALAIAGYVVSQSWLEDNPPPASLVPAASETLKSD